MRTAIKELLALGPLPASDRASVGQLQRFEAALEAITRPLAQDEATELAKLFGPDDCFGLAWSLLHLIETAPDLSSVLTQADETNYWIRFIWERLARSS